MPTYKEKLDQLKNILKNITNNPNYLYKDDIDINSTSLDFAGYLCKHMESYLESKKLLDKKIPVDNNNLDFKRIDLIDKYISDVVIDDVKKQSTLPFNAKTYRNSSYLFNLKSVNIPSANYYDLLTRPEQIKNNLGKPFTFDIDKFSETTEEVTQLTNYTPTNPIYQHLWSSEQLSEMSDTLVENICTAANNTREGAVGVIFAMVKYKGYSTDDIINGKVTQETANEIYDEIKAIGNLSKELKSPEVSDKEQKEKKLTELNDNFLYKFLNGYKKISDEFDKNVNYENTKDINNPGSMFHKNNRVLSSVMTLIGTNYCQDSHFVSNLNKLYQTKPIFTEDGMLFTIANTHDYLSDKAAGSIRLSNAQHIFRDLISVENNTVYPNTEIEKYLQLQLEMNSSFLDDTTRIMGVNAIEDIYENAIDLMSQKDPSPSLNLFFKKVYKEGQLFNDLTIDPQTGNLETSFSADVFEKEYNKYLQEEFYKDADINLSRTLKKDRDFHTFSSNEEITASINKANQYKAYNAWLSSRAAEEFEKIANVTNEYRSSSKDISLINESTLDRLIKDASNFKTDTTTDLKYSIFSFSERDANFLNIDPEKATKTTDEDKLKRIRHKLDILSEYTKGFSFNVSVNDEQYDIMEDLNQQYENAKDKNDFLHNLSTKTYDLSNDFDCKKVISPSVSLNTKIILKDSYEVALKKLKASSELDENGEPTGNSTYFDNMYKSIKAVTQLTPGDAQFNEKCQEANKYVSDYIRERDSFFKLHGYGTERLNVAKNLKSLTDKYYEQIISNDEYIKNEFEKVSSVFNVTHSWEETYEVEPQKAKEPQKIKEPEKVDLKKEEPAKEEPKKEEPLAPFIQITSPSATLREKNFFDDKSFVDVKYNVPEGLDEETCRVVVLGALLDEEVCSKVKTSSTGANLTSTTAFARTFFLENVFSENGDKREQEFGGAIKEGRLRAKEALDKYAEDPSLVAKYIENAAKITLLGNNDPLKAFTSLTVRRASLCEAVNNTIQKDGIKDMINLSEKERYCLNIAAGTKEFISNVVSGDKDIKESHKAQHAKALLTEKLLVNYVSCKEDILTNALDEKALEEEKENIFKKYPDIKKKIEENKKDPNTVSVKDISKINKKVGEELNLNVINHKVRNYSETQDFYKDAFSLIDSFNSSEEMYNKFFNLASTFQDFDELMKVPSSEINDEISRKNIFSALGRNGKGELENMMALLDGHVNSQRLISPLEEKMGAFRQTEGVLHGASPEYKAMITDLYNLTSHTKEIGREPSEIESRMNLAKMEELQLSTENYIKHKLDNPDTGSIGTTRLKEAQSLKTYLDKEIKNQKIRFDFAFENRKDSKIRNEVFRMNWNKDVEEPDKERYINKQLATQLLSKYEVSVDSKENGKVDKTSPIENLSKQFSSRDELFASVADLVSTSKYAKELKKLSSKDLTNFFKETKDVFQNDPDERKRLFDALNGKVTTNHIAAPLENTLSELKKTEGFLHGQSKQYDNMMKELDNYVKDVKGEKTEYKKSDVKNNFNKMESLLKAVDEYISYKDPQHDSGATGTKRLSEAKNLRKFLTASITDQENTMKFIERKTNNLRQIENVKTDLNKSADKNMILGKEKNLQKEKVNYLDI